MATQTISFPNRPELLPATVLAVHVWPGASVKKGDTLLSIQTPDKVLNLPVKEDVIIRSVNTTLGASLNPGDQLLSIDYQPGQHQATKPPTDIFKKKESSDNRKTDQPTSEPISPSKPSPAKKALRLSLVVLSWSS